MDTIKYNILSLFDGISMARVAAERAGISINRYYTSEIDKYAIQISDNNFPDNIKLGSVCDIINPPKDIDILIGGSPCTNLSIAGNRLGLDGEESKLFWEYVRILKEINPRWWILENVASMDDTNKNIITDVLGVKPVMIDAGLVSAQTRRRYFWANFKIEQPNDRGLLLEDILEPRTDKYDITDRMYSKKEGTLAYTNAWRFVRTPYQKARTLTTGGSNISNTGATNVKVNDRYYRLSEVECERLMGLEDGYTEGVSSTQRYKVLGNGFNVDVIAHIFKEMLKDQPNYYYEQAQLF